MSLYTELSNARSHVRSLKAQIKTAKKQRRQIATLKREAERLARQLVLIGQCA